EVGRGLERRPELVGLRLGFAVTRLGRQSAPDLRRDLLQGLAAALLDLDRLDRVKAERGPDRLGRHLALLQREERSLELGHDLTLAHEAQVAAPRRGR